MHAILGNIIVIAALAAVVALAVRSLWKSRKAGGGCTGDCASCGGCSRRNPPCIFQQTIV